MKAPFTTTPLQQFPYNSRTSTNEFSTIFDAKNYVLHGFKPGNALQASELNEIQENFYKNLTLHNILLKNWLFIGEAGFTSGGDVPLRGPSWMGAVPLHPFESVVRIDNDLVFKKDWYLIDDFSGLKFWVYNNRDKIISFPTALGTIIRFTIEKAYITTKEDSTLTDNSNGFSDSSLSPGADRYQLNITNVTPSLISTTSTQEPTRDILQVSSSGKLRYMNNLVYSPQ